MKIRKNFFIFVVRGNKYFLFQLLRVNLALEIAKLANAGFLFLRIIYVDSKFIRSSNGCNANIQCELSLFYELPDTSFQLGDEYAIVK